MKKNYINYCLLFGGLIAGLSANAQNGETSCYASNYLEYNVGTKFNGTPVDADRTNPEEAFGIPENDGGYNFTTLGYGGSLVLGFSEVAVNGEGADIRLFETTFNNDDCESYTEVAEVFLSQDGVDFYSAGTTCTNEIAEFDISDVNPDWTFISYVKIVDNTPEASVSVDGYDVDGVEAIHGCDLLENVISTPDGCPASEVLTYIQGTSNTGGAINPARTDANQALGAPENDDTENFVSLGYGGTLIVGFNQVALNGEGDDIQIFETTFGANTCETYEEVAEVWISQDGINYLQLGTTCTNEDAAFDISDVAPEWSFVAFVKVIDITSGESVSVDGYDVDAILALNGCDLIENHDITPGECATTDVISYVMGTQKNGNAISVDRTNPNLALGTPEDDDATMNFVSLGYGGSVILGFNGPVINGAGDDIHVVETSFSGPACTNSNGYEVADVYVSQDNSNYYFVGTICRDGGVDISNAEVELDYINYVKVVNNDDASTTPDGFDLDGVYALHNGCEIIIDDEGQQAPIQYNVRMTSYPNPVVDESNVTFSTSETSMALLEVYNTGGQKVAQLYQGTVMGNNEYKVDFSTVDLPNGIYIYRLTTDNNITTEKFLIAR